MKERLLVVITTFLFLFTLTLSRDTITVNSPLSHPETLISSGNEFTVGFFNAGNSSRWYLGIWYAKITPQTIVWVANRDNPLPDSTGFLSVTTNGSYSNLQLQTNSSEVFWSTNSSSSDMVRPIIARILDTGDFILMENDTNDVIKWRSFDHMTDTQLPGMKSGRISGRYNLMTSWSGPNDPTSSPNFRVKFVLSGWPEFFILNGLKRVYRTGPWNGIQFSGEPQMRTNTEFSFDYFHNKTDTYYMFSTNGSFVSRLVLNQSYLQRYVSFGTGWSLYWSLPRDLCDTYSQCGPNGVCNLDSSNSPACTCLTGFEPKYGPNWNLRDTADGCVRRIKLNCINDGFITVDDVKLPDSTNVTVYDNNVGLGECRKMCMADCECTAYSNSNVSNGGSGCAIWTGDLVDVRKFNGGGWTFYYRVAGSEVPVTSTANKKKRALNTAIIVIFVAFGLLILVFSAYIIRRKMIKNKENTEFSRSGRQTTEELAQPFAAATNKALEENSRRGNVSSLPIFEASSVKAATNNFAPSNKLGEGGFGAVYKGTLAGGEKIAVKRLADFSTQGHNEFKNELVLIAELQHVNLVRLLGCCMEGEELMLIYEYMENKSLDTFIFDATKSCQLDWQKRLEIIKGIARGVLYLHQDSRLRIIHRDLKASNVLLDERMNPKISDFGLARIFCGDQKKSHTNRVVGTYGYMSPEYAMDGIFSVKSDVFSFGVLVLEIVSGKKSRGIFGTEPLLNLLSYAWTLWKDGKALELLDTSISVDFNNSEIIRCVHVGLLCVQESPADRPHMSETVLMLNSPEAMLPPPKQPGYFVYNTAPGHVESSASYTVHDTTITTVEPR